MARPSAEDLLRRYEDAKQIKRKFEPDMKLAAAYLEAHGVKNTQSWRVGKTPFQR